QDLLALYRGRRRSARAQDFAQTRDEPVAVFGAEIQRLVVVRQMLARDVDEQVVQPGEVEGGQLAVLGRTRCADRVRGNGSLRFVDRAQPCDVRFDRRLAKALQ